MWKLLYMGTAIVMLAAKVHAELPKMDHLSDLPDRLPSSSVNSGRSGGCGCFLVQISNRPDLLQSRNPKVHFKVRKMPFWTPRKDWPQKSMKMSKKSFFWTFNSPKRDFLDIFFDFWGHVSRGSKMAFFGLLN